MMRLIELIIAVIVTLVLFLAMPWVGFGVKKYWEWCHQIQAETTVIEPNERTGE